MKHLGKVELPPVDLGAVARAKRANPEKKDAKEGGGLGGPRPKEVRERRKSRDAPKTATAMQVIGEPPKVCYCRRSARLFGL